MTSTSFNVGLSGDGSRLSSRVLRPPGGGHADIFGGDPEPPRGRRLAPQQPATNVIGQGDEPKPTNGTSEPAPQSEPAPAPVQIPEPVVESKPDKPEPASIPEPARAEPPKRVRVPPGGFSSGLW